MSAAFPAATPTVKSLAIVLGAGPGTGAALAHAFASKHAVALLARNKDSLAKVADDVRKAGGDVDAFSCDVSSCDSLDSAFKQIKERFPMHPLKAALFNANSPFVVKPFLELEKKDLDPAVGVNIYGAYYFSQKVIPLLLESGGGFLSFTGATAALKGSAKFAAFAPTKFALRGLSQSLAREFGPQNIHVVHAIIDGIIATEAVKGYLGEDKGGDSRIDPAAIASTLLHLAEQPKSCWTHEIDIRPSVEKW
ncbi:hypothetical protein JCM8097_008747 [Rhodosporidiobolus ruineniae]